MLREEVYQATKKVFGLYGALFDLVAREVGMEKALALHVEAHERLGITAGKLIQEKLGKEKPDLQRLGGILQESNLSIGIESELAGVTPTSIVFRNLRCPLYDGYRMGGLDDKKAETLCQRGAPAKLGSTLKYLNPEIKYSLRYYRMNCDEPCEEVIGLAQ
jgi:hypothetical protein